VRARAGAPPQAAPPPHSDDDDDDDDDDDGGGGGGDDRHQFDSTHTRMHADREKEHSMVWYCRLTAAWTCKCTVLSCCFSSSFA
jgi:hypothetical protein